MNHNHLLGESPKEKRKTYDFIYSDTDVFDSRVYEFSNLRFLLIENTGFAAMSDGIAALKKLYMLEIKNTKLEVLPNDLGELQKMNEFRIINSPIKLLPDGFYTFFSLSILQLEAASIEINAKILGLRALRQLIIKDTKISTTSVADLPKLLNLKQLTLSNIGMREVPESFTKMQDLEYLDISHNPITEFPKHILQMPRLLECKCDGVAVFHTNFRSTHRNIAFYRAFHAAAVAAELRYSFYLLFSGDVSICMDLPLYDLISALYFSVAIVEATARAVLIAKYADTATTRPLQKDAYLVVLGTTPRKKAELKTLLAQSNINYSDKPDAKATHILLGTSLRKEQIRYAADSGLPCLFPQELERFFEQQNIFFLTSADKNIADDAQQVEHLEQIFATLDEAAILVGLQLMQTNGVPKQLVTDLFLTSKNQGLSMATRRQALQLLKLNASEKLLLKLKSNYQLEQERFQLNNWTFYLQGSELEAQKMFDFAKKYIRYLPKEEVLLQLLENAPK